MEYTMTTPCNACPFLLKFKKGYSERQIKGFASGEFPCHKTAELTESEENGAQFEPTKDSLHCAGHLIYHEKRGTTTQMMRICERLGMYDHRKLNMKAAVR